MNLWDVLLALAVVAMLAKAAALCVSKKTRGGGCCGSGSSCARCRRCRADEDKNTGG